MHACVVAVHACVMVVPLIGVERLNNECLEWSGAGKEMCGLHCRVFALPWQFLNVQVWLRLITLPRLLRSPAPCNQQPQPNSLASAGTHAPTAYSTRQGRPATSACRALPVQPARRPSWAAAPCCTCCSHMDCTHTTWCPPSMRSAQQHASFPRGFKLNRQRCSSFQLHSCAVTMLSGVLTPDQLAALRAGLSKAPRPWRPRAEHLPRGLQRYCAPPAGLGQWGGS